MKRREKKEEKTNDRARQIFEQGGDPVSCVWGRSSSLSLSVCIVSRIVGALIATASSRPLVLFLTLYIIKHYKKEVKEKPVFKENAHHVTFFNRWMTTIAGRDDN